MRYALPAAVLLALCVGAGPATKPATPDSSAYPALQKLLAKLKAENDALKAENVRLINDLAAAKAEAERAKAELTAAKPKLPAKAIGHGASEPHLIEVGMTLDQAKALCGDDSVIVVDAARETETVYRITYPKNTGIDDSQGKRKVFRGVWGTFAIDALSKKVIRTERYAEAS